MMTIPHLLLGAASATYLLVAGTGFIAPPPVQIDIDYSEVLSSCNEVGTQRVHFVKAFKGRWPVPANFVLIGHAGEDLEYYDLAHRTWVPRRGSRLMFLSSATYEGKWSEIAKAVPESEGVQYGLSVRLLSGDLLHMPAAVVTDGNTFLVLMGPLVEALTPALKCYAQSLPFQ